MRLLEASTPVPCTEKIFGSERTRIVFEPTSVVMLETDSTLTEKSGSLYVVQTPDSLW